jgi:hypothetical protein
MNEAAMSGGADAPAEATGAPIDTVLPTHTEPLGSQTPVAEKPEKVDPDKPSESARVAIQKANEAIKAKNAEAEKALKEGAKETKVAEKQPAKVETQPRDRAPDGKFAARQAAEAQAQAQAVQQPVAQPDGQPQAPHREPPRRFDDNAKREWANTPEPVQASVHRALTELENGHQKYRADAQAFHEVREYAEMAKQGGTNLKSALTAYVGIESELRRDPVNGLFVVCQNLGIDPLAMASAMLERASQTGGRPQQPPIDPNALLAEAESRIENKFAEREAIAKIEQFRTERPRFDELQLDIEMFLTNGKVDFDLPPDQRLSEAYALAERLNPAPASASPAVLTPSQSLNQPKPLKTAGQKSITGAPANGSDPAGQPAPSKTTREAIRRAMARAG